MKLTTYFHPVTSLIKNNKCDHPLYQFVTEFYSGVCAYIPLSSSFQLLGHIILYRGADKSLTRPGRKQPRKHDRDARNFNKSRRELSSSFFFLQGKAPKEIHAILTKTLPCSFLVGLRTYQHPYIA